MIEQIREALSPLLPLRIDEVEYNDPMVLLSGRGWSLSVACPWQLMRDGQLATSYGDNGAAEVLDGLVEKTIVAVNGGGSDRGAGDLQLALDDGAILDVLVDTDLDPWVLRLPDHTFVGSASCS
jgi:hypothetical protein